MLGQSQDESPSTLKMLLGNETKKNEQQVRLSFPSTNLIIGSGEHNHW